jgi:hypothetical protein
MDNINCNPGNAWAFEVEGELAHRLCATCPAFSPCKQRGDFLEGQSKPVFGYLADETMAGRKRRRSRHTPRMQREGHCQTCGVPMMGEHFNRKYCDECRRTYNARKSREYRAKQKARTGGDAA